MPLLELRIPEIQFSALFSYMLWHIELKFCIWFCFTVLQIMLECCQFAVIFVGVMSLWIVEYRKYSFRTFLLHALTYWAEILHFTWFYCTTDQIECCQLPSNVVGVMPLLGLRILEIHCDSFPHFSLICFDISGWNFTYDFVLLYYRSNSSVVNFRQFFME